MKKAGIKTMFAMFTLMGGAFTLASCAGGLEKEPSTPTYVESSKSTETTDPIDTTDTTASTDTTDSSDEEKEKEGEKQTERINFEIKIEDLLENKINVRLEETAVSDVDAKYFTVTDHYKYGKTLETYGNVTMASTKETQSIVLGLPLTDVQFTNFQNLKFGYESVNYDLYQNCTNDQLSAVANFVENRDLTYNYAIKDGYTWDLDVLTPTKMESLIEEKCLKKANEYFCIVNGEDYFSSVDFRILTFFDNSPMYGDCIVLKGYATPIRGKIRTFSFTFKLSDENYNYLKKNVSVIEDQENDMAKNYTKTEMTSIYNVLEDSSTQAKSFNFYVTSYEL